LKHSVHIPSSGKAVNIEIHKENGKVIAVRHASERHLLKKPPAWAFSREVVEFFREKAVDELQVISNGVVYKCSFPKFCELAIKFDRGWGPQLALLLPYWSKG